MNKEVLKNAIKVFLAFVIASVLINDVLVVLASLIGIRNRILYDFVRILSGILTLIVIIIFSKDNFTNQLKDFKSNFLKNLKKIFSIWIVGFMLMIITNFVINVFLTHGIAPNEEANREVLFQYPIYSIVYMCLLAPIMEEILFRLNLKGIFKDKKGYILTSGLLFGFMHVLFDFSLVNLIYLIPYSILGCTFSTIFYETNNNVVSSSIAHIFHNSLSVVVLFLGV